MKNFFLGTLLILSVSSQAQWVDSSKNAITISYDYNHFQRQFATDWHIGSVEYKRKLNQGAVLGRLNYGNRLQQSGWQGELEAYPIISKKMYAYTGIGFSDNMPVFPKWRTGASLYLALPKAWEVEGGFRYLYFTESVWLGTAGISKYVGNWLFNAHTYFGFQNLSNNQSLFASARRYFNNGIDYAWLQAGSGISPDESRSIQLGNLYSLSSKSVGIGTNLSVAKRTQLKLSAGWFRNEYRKGLHDNQLNTTIGISQQF
ncbi:YaiO family outer membrane beta-barrel protein [Flavisolibacter tropicus]|uniref:YaiO family outer membrane beta-barrel protein n=1 Tax=Flavisolibacter tropicus TaxID=1492898 RepID=UPI00082E76F9|nr:YaiO family outer membrane beta-barrel protein [Flavisolibacter tropicus]